MIFAKRVFTIAGILGILLILPMYFLEERIGKDAPPAITHPEYFYGFLGVCLAWQVGFVVIGRDPVRFRPLMIPAVLEKATYGIAIVVLTINGRLAGPPLYSGLIDLLLGVLFVVSYVRTAPKPGAITQDTSK